MILVSFSRFDRTRGAKDQIFRTLYNFTISGEFSFTTAFDPDSHGACHGDELIYLFEPFYSHNGDPGLGPLSGDDLGQKLMLFSSSQTLKTLRF